MLPPGVSKGKWGKYGPANNWWSLAMGTGVLQLFWDMSFKEIKKVTASQAGGDVDPALYQEFNWHALESKRYHAIGRQLTGRKTR